MCIHSPFIHLYVYVLADVKVLHDPVCMCDAILLRNTIIYDAEAVGILYMEN